MRQKIIIGISALVLLIVLFLIFKDWYYGSGNERRILNERFVNRNRRLDTANVCYKELNQFKPFVENLNGIAVDVNSNIYITGNKEVVIYNKELKLTGNFKISSEANCINTDAVKYIYLGIDNHIEVYNQKGALIKKWKGYSEKGYITSIALKGKIVYAADAGNRLILKYDKEGNLQSVIGKNVRTSNNNQLSTKFIIPSVFFDIAIGPDGELWAANTGKHEIENFNDKGKLIKYFGKASMEPDGFGACCNPAQFSILPDGSFVTYEKGLNRIKIYNKEGNFVCLVAAPANADKKEMQYCTNSAMVHDLAVSPNGDIYVLETASGLIRVYTKK